MYAVLFLFSLFNLSFTEKLDDVVVCRQGTFQVLNDENPVATLLAYSNSKRDHVAALPNENDTVTVNLFENRTDSNEAVRCTLRVETCSSCYINVKYSPPSSYFKERELNLMPTCMESAVDPCFEIKFIEEKADTALDLIYKKISIWDEPMRSDYNSSGDSLLILLTMRNIEKNSTLNTYIQELFPFTISSLSNTENVTGFPSENILIANQSSVGFIESPRYPAAYPRSVVKKYYLTNMNTDGYVRLIFDDFHVHFQSELEVFDSDGSLLINTKNDHRRPPAFISRGNNMTVRFRGNDFTQMVGFRARYEFVEDHDWPEKPNMRNCDEHLEGYGGEIKLEGNGYLVNSYVDCIWIIGRLPHMSRTFDRIHLKVEDFHVKGVGLRLEVREGASSISDRLLLLFDSQTRDQLEHKQPRHGFTTSLTHPAYYVRLRGFLMSTSGLEIVYSQFYRWATALCPGIGEYHCDNARCIKATLRCDGINHCGDGSDEECHRPLTDHTSSMNRLNEFKHPEADISGLIALVVGVCGLILLLISTTAVITRIHRRRLAQASRALSPRNAAGTTAFNSDVTGPSIQTVGERRFYVVPENQISVIEAPPSYDDAMKHAAVTTTPTYTNQAYRPSTSESDLQQSRPLSPQEPPPVLEELDIENREPSSTQRTENDEIEADQTSNQPSTSRSFSSRANRDDESWV
ncbi:unnamed protein product [Auanema sp. JU1783]|nr:unnamed protein product [Auanema sp. JU1783]